MTDQNWKAPDDVAHVAVDVQKTFCEGGKLGVNGGNSIVPVVNEIQTHFNTNAKTRDAHPITGHSSFASAHPGKKPFDVIPSATARGGMQVLWPDHGQDGTDDAEFHDDLVVNADDLILKKGTNPDIDSYSGFFENDGKTRPRFADGETLTEKFQQRGIKRIVFTGLAFDYCVGWHALDAVSEGFEAIVVEDATKSIAPESEQAMRDALKKAGVQVVKAADLPAALKVG